MDRGAAAVVAAAFLAAAGCGAGAARPAPPPAFVPAAWALAGPAAGDTTAILWAFRTEDCLSCMAVDYDVRRVQARFGPAVPLIALHVGSKGESAIPRAYFRTRRVRVDRAVTLPPGEFRARYPGVVLPALYLLQGRRIAWSTASPPGTRVAPIQLDTLVRRLRQGLPPTAGTQPPRAPGSGGGA